MEGWIRKQRELLELESQAESVLLSDKIQSLTGKQCESEGLSILNLDVSEVKNALFGRCCLVLEKIAKLPLHVGFKVGDEVSLVSMNSEKSSTSKKDENEVVEIFGLVKSCNQQFIEIVVDDYDDTMLEAPYRLNLRPSMKTHEKMMDALSNLAHHPHPLFSLLNRKAEIQQNLESFLISDQIKVDSWVNSNLNDSQRQAVECCLNANLVGVIHGPPGTGKTSTIVELILQCILRGNRLLVCAPSNIAVDTILSRVSHALEHIEKQASILKSLGSVVNLPKLKNQMVRIGHPARVSTSILHYTLDYLISIDERTEIVSDVRKEIDELRSKLYQKRDSKKKKDKDSDISSYERRKELRSQLKAVQKEAVQREKLIVQGIVKNSKIVFATCVGAASRLLTQLPVNSDSSHNYPFDYAIIDEAAQGLEASCWIPIQLSKRVILAGDHCQLPPTIKCKEAETGGLSVTLFEKIITDSRFNKISTLLNIQYRMNDLINSWASQNMYQGNVSSDESVKDHTLRDILPAAVSISKPQTIQENHENFDEDEDDPNNIPVLMMIDTSNAFMYEDDKASDSTSTSQSVKKKTMSHRNQNEAELILQQTLFLVRKGIKPTDIGIITPYNGQLELLKEVFAPYFSNYVPPTTSTQNNTNPSTKKNVNLDGLDIKTIDGFQGGEKECILITFVRSNEQKNVGFLGENRRINVAITRAKRHLTIVCDAETCRSDAFISTLIDHIEDNGEIIPAEFYLSEFLLIQDSSLRGLSSNTKANKSKSVATTASSATGTKDSKQGQSTKSNNNNNEKFSNEEDQKRYDQLLLQIQDILRKYQKQEITGGHLIYRKESLSLDYSHLLPSTGNDSAIRSLIFPNSFNNYLRMNIHEFATSLSLYHESFGEKKKRYIAVSLVPFLQEQQLIQQQSMTKDDSIMKKDQVENISPGTAKEQEKEDAGNEEEDDEDENEEDGVDNKQNIPEVSRTKKKKSKKKPKKPAANTLTSDNNNAKAAAVATMDDDEFLAMQIEQNKKLAELHQYRLGSRPMPNYEKEYAKDKLKSKLAEKQDSRRIKVEAPSTNNSTTGSSTNRGKILKKPVPNFGGGKVGSK